MSETHTPRRILRSIGALFAGFVVVVVLSLGTDLALHAAGVFPAWGQPMSDALFLLATVYRTLYAIARELRHGAARAPQPMQHALVGGVVGLVLSTVGAVTTWDRGPEFGPHWYPLALVATAMPCAWAGGRLHAMREGLTLPARRRFLKTTSLVGAAVGLGEFAWRVRPARGASLAATEGQPGSPSWIDRPMRWAQLTLVEDDPGKFDLGFWLDYFQPHALRRRLPERRRLRGLLPDRGSVPPPQRLARRSRRRSASWSPAAASWAWS